VADAVAAAGAKGLTIPQAQRRLGWTYGATSGALSRAEARGLVRRPADLDKRSGYRPYTAVTA
jgi:DNA-binding MarR family transcriptional regulator